MLGISSRSASLKAFLGKCKRTALFLLVLYSISMRVRRFCCSTSSCVLWLVLLAVAVGGCPSKKARYPEEHARLLRIDQAVDSLRDAYQRKDRSRLRSMMLPQEQLDELQRQAEMDFETFETISLEFKTERIVIEKDDIEVFVHWQGTWKRDANDVGIRQRGHAQFQWVGTPSTLLRSARGDLPFGMRTKQTLSEPSSPQASPR
jgi:hypothetical protein